MLFSVIIPTYNRLSFLKGAIESVFKQTYKNYEIIVVDDASSDSTVEYLDTLGDRIKKVINIENRGVSYSRNIGIEIAKGNYIAFLDSDDIWEKTKLEEQSNFFYENPKIKICHTNEKWIRNGAFLNQSHHHKKQGGFFFKRATELCLVSPSSVVIKKDIFEIYGNFDETLEVCEDYDLWLRLNSKEYFGFIDKPLVIKQGGHKDQLSIKLPAMDYYRVLSMKKLLDSKQCTEEQSHILKTTIKKKLKILHKGAIKHNNKKLIRFCETLTI